MLVAWLLIGMLKRQLEGGEGEATVEVTVELTPEPGRIYPKADEDL